MPATTRSIGPNTPRRANITHSPGGPLTVHASAMPSTWARRTSGCSRCRAPSAAEAPEYSLSGATTTTSPSGTRARARTWRPTESIPSSLVTSRRGIVDVSCGSCRSAPIGGRSRAPGVALTRARAPCGTAVRSFDSQALTRSERPSSTAMNSAKRSRRASGRSRRGERHDPLRATGPHDDALALDGGEQVEGPGDDEPGHPQHRGDEEGGEHEGDVLDEVDLVGEVVEDADQPVTAGDAEQQPLQGDEGAADDDAEDEHQRRMSSVAGTERVADPHDVPLAGGVAPRQAVVLGHDRQLVGRPIGEAEGGGVGERTAGAVGGHRGGPFEPPRVHPRPHAQPVLGAHEPVGGRTLGMGADPLQHPQGDGDDGDPDGEPDAPATPASRRRRRRRRCASTATTAGR